MSTSPEPPREESPERIPVGAELQILATEHWGLLATRSMIWNEMFARTGMFLTTLSAAAVALALVAQATEFGRDFQLFAIIVLPVVLLIGVGTHLRLTDGLEEDVLLVIGMNRLRRAYLDRAPHLEPHFITSGYDDLPGLLQSYSGYGRPIRIGVSPGKVLSGAVAIVGVLNCVLVGIIAALVVRLGGAGSTVYLLAGVVAGLAVGIVVLGVVPGRLIAGLVRDYVPRFPREAVTGDLAGDGDPEE